MTIFIENLRSATRGPWDGVPSGPTAYERDRSFFQIQEIIKNRYVDLLEQPPLRLGGAPTHDPWLSIVYGGTRDAGHAMDLMDSP